MSFASSVLAWAAISSTVAASPLLSMRMVANSNLAACSKASRTDSEIGSAVKGSRFVCRCQIASYISRSANVDRECGYLTVRYMPHGVSQGAMRGRTEG